MYKTTFCKKPRSFTSRLKTFVVLGMMLVGFGSYAQYCEVTSTSTSYGIGNFTTTGGILNINNSTSGGSYSDYTSMVVAQFEGGTNVEFTITSANSTAGMGLWIDWNDDGDFEDAGENVYNSNNYVSVGTGTITIPAGTEVGEYRMRVVANWLSTSPTPCGNLGNAAYGEAEDYTFSVIEQPDCMPPSGLTVLNISDSSAEIEWTAPENQDLWHVYVVPADEDAPDETTTEYEEVTENPFTIEDLDPTTEYVFYVRADCGNDDGQSFWAHIPFTTGCTAFNLPFWEGFNSDSTTEQCWTVLNGNNDTDEWDLNYTTTPYEGNQSAMMYTDYNSGDNDDWLISPQIDLTNTLGAARLRFHYKAQSTGEPNDFRVMLSTTGINPDDFTVELLPLTEVNSTTYQEMIINLVDNDGDPIQGEVYVAFHVPEDGLDGYRLYIDNVIIEPYNSNCPDPTDLTINETTEDTIEIDWTADEDQDLWHVYVVPKGGDAPDETATDYEEVTETPYIIDELDSSTEYDIYVRSDCGNDNGLSYWVGPLSAMTTQVPAELPFEEDFEGDIEWTLNNGTQTNKWVVGDATGNEGNSLYISNDDGESNQYTNTSTTVVQAYRDIQIPEDSQSVLLSFDWKGVAESCCDYIRVWVVSTDYVPVPGTQIPAANGVQFGGNYNSQSNWTNQFFEIPTTEYAGQIIRLVFEWRNDSSVGSQPPGAIDNIEVSEITCPTPTDIGVDGVTTDSADLSWTSEGDLFDIEWGEAGFEQGDGEMIEGVTDNPYTLEDLEEETGYEYYVRRDCGEDGVSAWAGPFYFYTGYCEVSTTSTIDYTSAFSTSGAFQNVSYTVSSQPAGSYDNQTDSFITLSAGMAFDFSTTYVGGANGVNIWIDYNDNLIFEDDELVFSLADSNTTKTGTITVPGDTPIGEYRMRVRSQYGSTANPPACGSVTYGSTIDFTLNVVEEPDCMPPSGLGVDGATFESADLSWTSDGDLFDIEWGEVGFEQGEGEMIEGVTNPYTLEDLEAETGYEYYVRQDCGEDGVSLWAGPFYFYTGYCQGSSTSTSTSYRITGFSTTNGYYNIWNLNNGTANYYNNYSSMVVSESAGGNFDYAVSVPGYTNVEIWIDYDNNMMFDEDELVAEHTYESTATTFTGTINIPADVENGDHRIRVRSRYYYNTVADPCSDMTYGEIEDYTLRVEEEPDCIPPSDIEIEVTCDVPPAANITWEAGGSESSWEYVITEDGEPEPTEGTVTDENIVQVDDLEPNQDYVFWVRSLCGEDGDSVWIGIPFNSNATPVSQAQPFCAGEDGGIIFPNVSDADNAEEYGSLSCLGSTPNPVWYYLQIDQSGELDFQIIQNTAFDANGNPTGQGLDVDFIAWGPFDSMPDACSQIDLETPTQFEVDCSYSAAPVENFSITNAQEGEIYVLLITNYNGDPGFIKLEQTNLDANDAGNTDCSFLCEVDLGDDIVVCAGTEVVLEGEVASAGSSTDVTATRWYHNDELIDSELYSEDGLSITVTASGIYRLEVEKEMCTEEVVFDEIEVTFVPAYGQQIPPTIELCDELNDGVEIFDLQQYIDSLDLGPYDITLYPTLEDAQAGTNPLPGSYESGNTTIYAKINSTVLNTCGSIQEVELILTPLESPVVEFSYDEVLCYDNLDFIIPYYTEGFTFGGTFSSTAGLFIDSETGEIDVQSSVPGTYVVLYDYKVTPGNCGEDDSFTTTVTISEPINFELGAYCNGGETIVDATNLRVTIPDENYTLTWIGAEKISENTAVVRSAGTVTLHVEDQDGCYKEFYINVEDVSCEITKGISPNGDGLNDRFDLSNYWVIDLKIYNRDGREVYSHGMGYTDEWEGQTNNGNLLPDGTYYYRIVTNVEEFTGWVQLVREIK